MKLADIHPDKYIPLDYARTAASTGMRIGGTSPVAPLHEGPFQRYFATLDFQDLVLSIFYAFDVLGEDAARDIIAFNNQLLLSSQLIHVVVHSAAAIETSTVPATVSAHKLECGPLVVDDQWDASADGQPFPYSKLGGRPFISNVPLTGEAFRDAERRGFRQLAQFDTPNPRTHPFVQGFPFDPGSLHVLFKGGSPGAFEFAFVIQQA